MSPVRWADLKAHELRQAATADAIVIIPVAAIEQHGPHLPVQVDSRLAEETSCRAAQLMRDRDVDCIVTPTVWSGLSEHHIPFGGTLSVDYETFYALLKNLMSCLKRQGFRRVLINNGHGGNVNAMKVATHDLTVAFDMPIAAVTYPLCAVDAYAEILEDQQFIAHACEAETSMMLAVAPELVDDSNLAAMKSEKAANAPAFDSPTYRWAGFDTVTPNGVIGNPTRATAEKGEKLLAASAQGLAEVMSDPATWAASPDIRLAETGGVPLNKQEV